MRGEGKEELSLGFGVYGLKLFSATF